MPAEAPTQRTRPAARTRRLMLETAIRLMQSRHDAFGQRSRGSRRRFARHRLPLFSEPGRAGAGGGRRRPRADPDLVVRSRRMPKRRVADLIDTAMPRIEAFEATFKAALKLSLDQWAQRPGRHARRGAAVHARPPHRPAQGRASRRCRDSCLPSEFDRLAQALSLVFGVEVLIVLKDIWGLDGRRNAIGRQMGGEALVRAALEETCNG